VRVHRREGSPSPLAAGLETVARRRPPIRAAHAPLGDSQHTIEARKQLPAASLPRHRSPGKAAGEEENQEMGKRKNASGKKRKAAKSGCEMEMPSLYCLTVRKCWSRDFWDVEQRYDYEDEEDLSDDYSPDDTQLVGWELELGGTGHWRSTMQVEIELKEIADVDRMIREMAAFGVELTDAADLENALWAMIGGSVHVRELPSSSGICAHLAPAFQTWRPSRALKKSRCSFYWFRLLAEMYEHEHGADMPPRPGMTKEEKDCWWQSLSSLMTASATTSA
jgi:hypothetical protein